MGGKEEKNIEVASSLRPYFFFLTFINLLSWLGFAQVSGDNSGNGSIQDREGIPETQEVLAPSYLPIRVNSFGLFVLTFLV